MSMEAANNQLVSDYNALLQNPSNQTLFAAVRQDVVNYYLVQEGERGYATLAASVAGGTGYNGNVALNNIMAFYNDSAFGMNELKVAAGLALQDYSNITGRGSIAPSAGGTIYVPTIVDDDIEHQQVFGDLNLPLTYWSGTSIAAYNVNWMGPIATSAELQGVADQAPLFATLSPAQICQSFLNLASAVEYTNYQTYQEYGQQFNPLVPLTGSFRIYSRPGRVRARRDGHRECLRWRSRDQPSEHAQRLRNSILEHDCNRYDFYHK